MTNEFTERPGGIRADEPATTSGPSAETQGLKDKVSQDLSAARAAVMETRDSAAEKVTEGLTEQKNFAATQVGGIASALEKVGAELESTDQPQVGHYAREIGQSVHGLARSIEGKGLGEIATMAEDFGRRQPIAFLSVAALAGFAASRFLTASSQRTSTTSSQAAPADPSATTPFEDGGFEHG